MATGNLKIHTENILPIIKKWLYSDKDIFLRELVSNACDAMQKLKVLREQGEASFEDSELRIDITIDKANKKIVITDTGLGMTVEEVEKYIAQLAFSGAEEFLGKYKSSKEEDQIIGHFGLGFYSAYMVASQVEIDTLSYQKDAQAALWTCDGSSTYTLDQGTRTTRGTQITLHVSSESEEFLEESRIKEILDKYCAFLPYPIYLNSTHINSKQPLWLKPASECTDKDYIDFYHQLYPLEADPVFWVHLNVDYPFHLKGILYFPKIHKRFDWNQNTIKLFCNRVFVSDNCKDLIPDFLMALKGALDSPDIPLNVSRSYLQMDSTVRQLGKHVSKKISDKLASIYDTNKELFLNSWSEVELVVKLGCLQDEKFYERCKKFLVWKSTKGDWMTVEEYLENRKDKDSEKVFYTTDLRLGKDILSLYEQKGHTVLIASSPVDSAIINFLESKLKSAKFQRIDGALDDSILDSGNTKTEASEIAEYFRSKLDLQNIDVEAKSLASDSLPAMIVVDESTRRFREYMALSGQSLPTELGGSKKFVLNTNSKLISAIYSLKEKDPELSKEMIEHVYELSLLSQRELDPEALAQFVSRSSKVLEKLASQA